MTPEAMYGRDYWKVKTPLDQASRENDMPSIKVKRLHRVRQDTAWMWGQGK